MAKIMISSLFTYDPLINVSQGRQQHGATTGEKSIVDEGDIATAIFDTMKKVVVNEMVQSVMLCVMKKEIDNLVLILDNRSDPLQDEALKIIQSKVGDSAGVEIIKVDGTDALSVAQELVGAIDSFDKGDEICVNISSLKHTKTLGVIYGAYSRSDKVKEILYVNKEDRKIIKIPKLSLNLTKNQRKILLYFKHVQEGKQQATKKKVYDHFKIDKSSFYYLVNMLRDKGLLESDNTVTEMGEVALL